MSDTPEQTNDRSMMRDECELQMLRIDMRCKLREAAELARTADITAGEFLEHAISVGISTWGRKPSYG